MSSSVSTTDGTSSTTSPKTTTTTTTTTTLQPETSTPTSTTSMYPSTQTESQDNLPIILGVVIGSVVLVGVILVLVVFFVLRRRRNRRPTEPPMLPDPKQPVVLEASQSTSILVDNQFPSATVSLQPAPNLPESPNGGNSADGLPMAPPVPVNYEATDLQDDLYVNRGAEPEIQGDYVAPSSLQLPVTEDLYMPMSGSTNPSFNDLQLQIPSHELAEDYTLPSIPKPPACKGSFGYINVPNYDSGNASSGNVNTSSRSVDTHSGKTYTLPKYANLAEGLHDEVDLEQDYENVQDAKALAETPIPSKAKSATPSPIPKNAKASAHQMADILMKNIRTNGSPRLKPSPNKTKTTSHSKQNTSSSCASSTPESKKKNPVPPSSDSAEDYVNVKKLLKKNGNR